MASESKEQVKTRSNGLLSYAKKVMRLRVSRNPEEVVKMRNLAFLINDYYVKLRDLCMTSNEPVAKSILYATKYRSFLPVKGYRIDGDKKTYFFYLVYHLGRTSPKPKERPNVILLAVGNEDYVNKVIDEYRENIMFAINHVTLNESEQVVPWRVPSPFWRKFEPVSNISLNSEQSQN